MPKFVVYTSREFKRIVEAESAEEANKLIHGNPEELKKGAWTPTGTHWHAPRGTHEYVPPVIDWDAVAKLPKPSMSADEMMGLMREPTLKLYFVNGSDPNDVTVSLDLFLQATSPEEALNIWREWLKTWWGEEAFTGPLVKGRAPPDEDDFLRIFELDPSKLSGEAGVLAWHTEFKCVAYVEA